MRLELFVAHSSVKAALTWLLVACIAGALGWLHWCVCTLPTLQSPPHSRFSSWCLAAKWIRCATAMKAIAPCYYPPTTGIQYLLPWNIEVSSSHPGSMPLILAFLSNTFQYGVCVLFKEVLSLHSELSARG